METVDFDGKRHAVPRCPLGHCKHPIQRRFPNPIQTYIKMTQPRDPRPTCPPEPLEITEEEYRATQSAFTEAYEEMMEALDEWMNKDVGITRMEKAGKALKAAQDNLDDAQRRAASDHQTLWRDDPAYRREVRERDYLP